MYVYMWDIHFPCFITLTAFDIEFTSSLVAQTVKNPPENIGDHGLITELRRTSRGGHGTHSSILAWRTQWTEEPDGLQFIGSQRVGHDWAINTLTFLFYNSSIIKGKYILKEEPKKKKRRRRTCFLKIHKALEPEFILINSQSHIYGFGFFFHWFLLVGG